MKVATERGDHELNGCERGDRRAVEEIVTNCGASVRWRMAGDPRFPRQELCLLARTDPEYQPHLTAGEMAGELNPLLSTVDVLRNQPGAVPE